MNAATTSPFALVAEFLADFIASLFPVWVANGCLMSEWQDGSLDQALQALQAGDGPTALGMLALAQQQAREPVKDEPDAFRLTFVEQERQRMALAARVATALTREAMRQPAPRIAWNEPPEGEELLIFTLEDTQGEAIEAQTPSAAKGATTPLEGEEPLDFTLEEPQGGAIDDLEPLELPEAFRLIFEPLALPALAGDAGQTSQGGAA
jgi:hypothetical protein